MWISVSMCENWTRNGVIRILFLTHDFLRIRTWDVRGTCSSQRLHEPSIASHGFDFVFLSFLNFWKMSEELKCALLSASMLLNEIKSQIKILNCVNRHSVQGLRDHIVTKSTRYVSLSLSLTFAFRRNRRSYTHIYSDLSLSLSLSLQGSRAVYRYSCTDMVQHVTYLFEY